MLISLSHPSLCVSVPSAVRLPADQLRGAAHAAALPDRQGTDPRAHLVNRTVFHSVERFPPDSLLCSASKGERESPSSRRAAGPAHRRHVRTIQEVRTTITRIITDVYYEDGKEVERKVSEVTGRFTLQSAFLSLCTGKGCCLFTPQRRYCTLLPPTGANHFKTDQITTPDACFGLDALTDEERP